MLFNTVYLARIFYACVFAMLLCKTACLDFPTEKTIGLSLWLIIYHCFLISMTVYPTFHRVGTIWYLFSSSGIPILLMNLGVTHMPLNSKGTMHAIKYFSGVMICHILLQEDDEVHDRALKSFEWNLTWWILTLYHNSTKHARSTFTALYWYKLFIGRGNVM